MKEVLLSADGKISMYSVPDEAADHLENYCLEFCSNWIWKDPNGAKLLKTVGGMTCAVFDESDFIAYLNEWVFPQQPSKLVERLDYDCGDELPEEYGRYPYFNF